MYKTLCIYIYIWVLFFFSFFFFSFLKLYLVHDRKKFFFFFFFCWNFLPNGTFSWALAQNHSNPRKRELFFLCTSKGRILSPTPIALPGARNHPTRVANPPHLGFMPLVTLNWIPRLPELCRIILNPYSPPEYPAPNHPHRSACYYYYYSLFSTPRVL